MSGKSDFSLTMTIYPLVPRLTIALFIHSQLKLISSMTDKNLIYMALKLMNGEAKIYISSAAIFRLTAQNFWQ